MSRTELLPTELVRVLSGATLLRLRVGEEDPVTLMAAAAAFEDTIFLFISPRAAAVERMRLDPRARLEMDGADGLRVRLKGRCVAGNTVMANKRRMELLPWLPEGMDPKRTLAIPFWTEEVDYQRPAPGERFTGRTPALVELSLVRRLVQTGLATVWPFVCLGIIIQWGFVSWKGPEMPLRPIALVLGLLAIFGAQQGLMLGFRALAFQRWRLGLLTADQAPLQTQGLLAPVLLLQLCAVGVTLSVVCVLATLAWGWDLAVVTLTATMAWALVPLLGLRLRG
ncbi:MAG: hypothetical protein ACI9VR_004590 [Cognaticolwellia sp.]|jgi:hypothetical protein